jgi:hypothetical protein
MALLLGSIILDTRYIARKKTIKNNSATYDGWMGDARLNKNR